jgi:hypothetical protein
MYSKSCMRRAPGICYCRLPASTIGEFVPRLFKQLRLEADQLIRELAATTEPMERKELLKKLRTLLNEADQHLKHGEVDQNLKPGEHPHAR